MTGVFRIVGGSFAARIFHGLLVTILVGLAACATTDNAQSDLQDFQQELHEDEITADSYTQSLRDGHDLSEFAVGWYVYDVLTILACRDEMMLLYFNNHGGDIAGYMKTTFHDRPEQEVATLQNLAKQQHPALRRAAAQALESLRHIPNPSEEPDIQARDRQDLAKSLAALKAYLEESAREAATAPTGRPVSE